MHERGKTRRNIDSTDVGSTRQAEEAGEQLRALFTSMIPLGRMGRADEIAAAALFLASSESSFVTGIDLPVNGLAQV